MFCVLYEFDVLPENANAFQAYWRTLTLEIKRLRGSLGSRLHKVANTEGKWVAYAQWPSREAWKEQAPTSDLLTELRDALKHTCRTINVIYELELSDDLLEAKLL